jgi:hypothetical protein
MPTLSSRRRRRRRRVVTVVVKLWDTNQARARKPRIWRKGTIEVSRQEIKRKDV